jgi:hypothetical protein
MAWLKVFARLIKTTTATDDEVCVCEGGIWLELTPGHTNLAYHADV